MVVPTLYSMERRISVVMMRQGASGFMLTSPVSSPTCGTHSACHDVSFLDNMPGRPQAQVVDAKNAEIDAHNLDVQQQRNWHAPGNPSDGG